MKKWRYRPSPDLEHSFWERLRRFPRQPEMAVWAARTAAAAGTRLWLRAYHRLSIHGRPHLPEDGRSFVMVANHGSHLDALCLLAALPLSRVHRAFPAAAADYFYSSLPRAAAATVLVNGLPFDRKRDGEGSLERCRRLLAEPGHVLILFPEGTRTTSGDLGRFRSGIGRLVAGTRVPVVPCRLHGATQAWPKGRLLPAPKRLRLNVGMPRTYAEASPDRAGIAEVCDDLRREVLRL